MDSAESVMMTTSVAVTEWIKRIVDDERRRDAARVKEDDLAAQKADVVRRNGRRLARPISARRSRAMLKPSAPNS